MRRRQPLPNLWMMTDERMGDCLLPAIRRLPPGSGIVFRHYGLPPTERRALFERIRRIARARRLLLFLAGGDASAWRADGAQGNCRRGLPCSASVHSLREIRQAQRSGADLLFLSPVFPTRSHPGAGTLGIVRFNLLARATPLPVIALGGMNRRRAPLARAYGWAAIDAHLPGRHANAANSCKKPA